MFCECAMLVSLSSLHCSCNFSYSETGICLTLLCILTTAAPQSVHILVLMIHRTENERRIIILSLILSRKLQQKVNSQGICFNLAGFNEGRIIYCYAGGFRCHMSMESRIGLYIRGKPLTSFCPPTDQIIVYFSDDKLILNDQDLSPSSHTKYINTMFLQTSLTHSSNAQTMHLLFKQVQNALIVSSSFPIFFLPPNTIKHISQQGEGKGV